MTSDEISDLTDNGNKTVVDILHNILYIYYIYLLYINLDDNTKVDLKKCFFNVWNW